MLATITALLLVLLIFTPSSAIWLNGGFIHKPTLLNCFQSLVSQISALFRASSPWGNSIFSPRKAVNLPPAFPGESSLLACGRSELSTLLTLHRSSSWDCPGAQIFPPSLTFQILPPQQVHWTLLHSSPACQLVLFFIFQSEHRGNPLKHILFKALNVLEWWQFKEMAAAWPQDFFHLSCHCDANSMSAYKDMAQLGM